MKRTCERSFSENSSSEGSSISEKKAISQVKNQQGQGMSKKMMIPQKYHQLSRQE